MILVLEVTMRVSKLAMLEQEQDVALSEGQINKKKIENKVYCFFSTIHNEVN